METLYLTELLKNEFVCIFSNRDKSIIIKTGFLDNDQKQIVSLYQGEGTKSIKSKTYDLSSFKGAFCPVDFANNYKNAAKDWGYELAWKIRYSHDDDDAV